MVFTEVEAPSEKERHLAAKKGIAILWDVMAFDHEVVTLQFIKQPSSKGGKVQAPVRCYAHTEEGQDAALRDCVVFNEKGYDIFWMVNEGDGEIHEGQKVARSQQSVVRLTACFMDTDSCPWEDVRDYISDMGALLPNLRVESSPGRYHLYWWIKPEEVTDEVVTKWQAVQHMLHRLGVPTAEPSKLGTDATMHDYAKVLRVPGFMHVKKVHLVRVVEQTKEGADRTLDDIYSAVGGEDWEEAQGRKRSAVQVSLNGNEHFEQGDRYNTLQSISLQLANRPDISAKEKAKLYSTFVRDRLDNSDEVYCTREGDLTEKARELFRSALEKVTREATKQDQELLASAGASFDSPTRSSPWHLPDEFYLNAPNGFGDVVRQVMEYSLYPCAALAFGTFLTGLSVLKARKWFTPGGNSPALYTLNVAISGYGKGDPMTLLQNMLHDQGLGKLVENEIRSDRGIYEHLSENEGVGLFLLDEVAPLLRSIQKEDANTHHSFVSKALLSLYSAGALKRVSCGKVAKSKGKGEPVIVLNNPSIGICAYTVPVEFDRLFDSDSVSKGLFQRFIPIVPEIELVAKSPKADKHAIVRSELFDGFAVEEMKASALDDEGQAEAVPPLMNIKREKVVYTRQAERFFEELDAKYRHLLISTAQDPELADTSGLYSRLAEQIERVATVLSDPDGEVSLKVLEWAAEFIESRHKATVAVSKKTILRGRGNDSMRKEEVVVRTLAKLISEDSAEVAKRDVYMSCRRHFKDTKEFEQALLEAVTTGAVETRETKRSRRGPPSTLLRLGQVI